MGGRRQVLCGQRQALNCFEHAAGAFGGAPKRPKPVDLAPLQAKIGQLTLENDFLEGALTKSGLLSTKR